MIPANSLQTQGGGAVTSDQLNTFLQGAAGVAALRSFTGLDGMTVWMQGTTAPNDNGQGIFFYDSDATAPDDNGVTTIQPNGVTGAGRWVRQPIATGSLPANSVTLSQIQTIPALTILGNNTGATANVMALTVAQVISMLGGVATPSGTVAMFALSTPPAGWLICDGSAVSRTTYAGLFAVIGSTWGAGDGSTTFNLPNLLGQFARGWDSSGAVDPGRAFASKQTSALQNHVHIESLQIGPGATPPQFGVSTIGVTLPGFTVAGTNNEFLPLTNDGTATSGYNPNPGGQISTVETRPINVAISFIIKT